MDSAKRKRLEEQLRPFRAYSFRYVAIPAAIGVWEVVNVVQRLPINPRGLYGIETILMALNGVSAIIAFTAIVTRRHWAFAAGSIWVVLGTIRLLGVGHLQ